MPNTEEAVEGIAMSTTALIAQLIKQGPWAIIAGILCWGIFVTVPELVERFGKEQDALRDVFSTQMQAQRDWFDKREAVNLAQRAVEFKELILEQKETTKTLHQTNESLRELRSSGLQKN